MISRVYRVYSIVLTNSIYILLGESVSCVLSRSMQKQHRWWQPGVYIKKKKLNNKDLKGFTMPNDEVHAAFHNQVNQLVYYHKYRAYPVPKGKEEEVRRLSLSADRWAPYTGIPITAPVAIPMYLRRKKQTRKLLGIK